MLPQIAQGSDDADWAMPKPRECKAYLKQTQGSRVNKYLIWKKKKKERKLKKNDFCLTAFKE